MAEEETGCFLSASPMVCQWVFVVWAEDICGGARNICAVSSLYGDPLESDLRYGSLSRLVTFWVPDPHQIAYDEYSAASWEFVPFVA